MLIKMYFPMTTQQPRLVMMWITTGLILTVSFGCSGGNAGAKKLSVLNKGMPLADVESVLGKPIFIVPSDGESDDYDVRRYKGDDGNTIVIMYKKGIAERIHELPAENNRIPFG